MQWLLMHAAIPRNVFIKSVFVAAMMMQLKPWNFDKKYKTTSQTTN